MKDQFHFTRSSGRRTLGSALYQVFRFLDLAKLEFEEIPENLNNPGTNIWNKNKHKPSQNKYTNTQWGESLSDIMYLYT